MDGRWRFLVAVVVSACALAGTAQASPVFTTGGNISAAGQSGFEPKVTVDPAGNAHAVWTRSDGTNLRIQYATRTPTGSWSTPVNISDAAQGAFNPQIDSDPSGNLLVVWARSDGANLRIQATFKPSGGGFSTPVNISDPGFDAVEPQVNFDGTGKAVAVWSRADGSNPSGPCCGRVQASIRSAGPAGVFQNEVTLSDPGQDAFDAQIATGPDADSTTVLVWVRSDGTNTRVQSARRRDYVGYPRPLSASFIRASLTPAYDQCQPGSANRVHGTPLAFASCNPPSKTSSVLTVGTSDANGFAAGSISSVRWKAIVGDTLTEANEADVQAIIKITDVRNQSSGTDYTGLLGVRVGLEITDQRNADEQPEAGTTVPGVLEIPVQCVTTTSTTIGGACNATTSLNALFPGAAVEKKRSIWELGQTLVRDAGANGTGYAACPPTCGDGDEKVFMRQGIFVP